MDLIQRMYITNDKKLCQENKDVEPIRQKVILDERNNAGNMQERMENSRMGNPSQLDKNKMKYEFRELEGSVSILNLFFLLQIVFPTVPT